MRHWSGRTETATSWWRVGQSADHVVIVAAVR